MTEIPIAAPQTLVLEKIRAATRATPTHPGAVLVDDLSLTIIGGRIQALVGASGSGKSMACSTVLDVLPPGVVRTGGRALLDGTPRTGAELRGRVVASVMQNPRSAFNPVLTMNAHARETLRALGVTGREARETIEASLAEVGLEDARRVLALHPFEMSGGMLQRMMIALALMSGAQFLFADEPTTDLDLVVQMRVLDLIERLVDERGLGVLLVTHDMGVVARLADDVAVMSEGRLVEEAPVDAVFRTPSHSVSRALVAAHLSLYGEELAS